MFCSNCGAKLAEDSLFCHKCGARVIPSVEIPSGEETDEVIAAEVIEMQAADITEETDVSADAAEMPSDADSVPSPADETETAPSDEESSQEETVAEEVSADEEAAEAAAEEPAEVPSEEPETVPTEEDLTEEESGTGSAEEAPAEEETPSGETADVPSEDAPEVPSEEEASAEGSTESAETSDETVIPAEADGEVPAEDAEAPSEEETVQPEESEETAATAEAAEETDAEEELPSPAAEVETAAVEEASDTVAKEDEEAPAEVPVTSEEAETVQAPLSPIPDPLRARRQAGATAAQAVPEAARKAAGKAAAQKTAREGKKINLNSPLVKILAAILGVALVFGTFYYIVFNKIRNEIPVPDDTDNVPVDNTPEPSPEPSSVSQDLELGRKALEEKNYITAVTYLEKAYSADPKSVEAEDLLRRALSELQKKYAQEGDFTENEKYLLKMQDLWQDQNDKLAVLYTEWLRSCSTDPDRTKGQEVLSRAKEYIDRSDTILYTYLFREPFDAEEFASRIAVFYGSDEPAYISMAVHYNNEFIAKTLKELNMDELCINTEDCEYPYVILRRQKDSGGFSVYYGELDESGKRGGIGSFYTYVEHASNPVIHYFTSRWSENAPNGQFTEVIMSGENFSEVQTYKGTVKNGYYQGTITMTIDGITYEGSYDNGKIIPIRKTEDGRTIVAEATDGSSQYLYASMENDTNRYGLNDWS